MSTFERFGIINGALYVLNATLRRIAGERIRIYRYYLLAQPLKIALPSLQLPSRMYETRILDDRDSDIIAAFPRPPHVIEGRYAQGSICVSIHDKQQFVGFLWISAGPYDEDEVRCRYVPQPSGSTVWDYDLYIAPEFRNSFAFLRLWGAATNYLRSRRIGWSFSRVSAFSPASLSVHRRMGAIILGSAFFFKIFGIQITLASVPPYVHLCWGERPGPVFTVTAPIARHANEGAAAQ